MSEYDLTAYNTTRHGDVPGCNCASHGLLDGNRHGLGCPYGQGWTRAWIAENRKPWGHQMVVHIYVEGPYTSERISAVNAAVLEAVPDAEFVGISIEGVQTKPSEQVAS